ncbi:MAG: filamentous hemagglutinin N-terminal domain-containing protein, partial [Candidatus Omnitrophota bacterium]
MKTKKMLLTILVYAILPATLAFALPQDAQVENGQVTIETPNSTTMNITAGDKAIINFSSFNIAQNETVNFIQPSSNAACLSRVTGSDASVIAGNLSANGILFLVNPNGINFTPTANVQVNHLVASTLDISNNNFINGNYELIRNQNKDYAKILNEGYISGTNIALIGSAVENKGIIVAQAGTVHLASGDKVVVSFDRRGLINVEITEATSGKVIDGDGNTVKDAVSNSGTIEAHQVFMSARTARDIFENAIKNTGDLRANTMKEVNGVIKIIAGDKFDGSKCNIQLYGNMVAYNILVSATGSVTLSGATTLSGNTIIAADDAITVKASLRQCSGSVSLLADNNDDGEGQFTLEEGASIEALGAGDIAIDGSGVMTLNGPITAANGDVLIGGNRTPAAIVSNNTEITSNNKVSTAAKSIMNVTAIAPKVEFYKNTETLYIENIETNDTYINIAGDGINVKYLKTSDVTFRSDGLIDMNPAVILSAPTLTLIADRFGACANPIKVDTANLNIQKTTGDIDIIQSAGIGTSILICGPPDESFGSILYNEDANISIVAVNGNITIEKDVTIYSSSSLVNLETLNHGDIIVNGTLSAPNGVVRLWTCGLLDLRQTKEIISKAGGYIYNPYDYTAVSWIGGTGNSWGTGANWSGGAVPNTNAYQVTIDLASAAVTTSTGYTIGELIIGSSNTCSLTLGGTLTLDDGDATLEGSLTIGSYGTLSAAGYTISVDGNWSNSGTFTHGNNTVDFTKASGTQTLNSGGQASGKVFYSLTHSGAGTLSISTNHVKVSGGYLTLNAGTLAGGTCRIDYYQYVNDGLTISGITMGATNLNDFYWHIESTVTQKAITLPNGFVFYSVALFTWNANLTATGNFNLGNNKLDLSSSATGTPTNYLNMDSYTLTAGNLTMGWTGGYNGYLKFGSSTSHSITDIARWTATGNIIDFGSSTVAISGTSIDFSYISVTCGTSTIDFTGGSGVTQVLNSNSNSFKNITHSGAGTLQLSTNTLTVTGAFTNSAGTFDANALAVTVTGLTTVSGGEYKASTALQTFNGGLTVSGGTFTCGASGSVDVNGAFALSSGTFTQATSTLNVSGSFTLSSSTTFTKATGSQALTFDGTGSITDNNTSKKNLGAVTSSSGTRTATTDILMSSISVSGGTFIDGGKTITVNGTISIGSSVTLTSTGTWVQGASGDISNSTNTNGFYNYQVAASVTVNLVGYTYVKNKITLGASAVIGSTSGELQLASSDGALVSDFLDMGTGSNITCILRVNIANDVTITQKAFSMTGTFFIQGYYGGLRSKITMTGNWTIGGNIWLCGGIGATQESDAFTLDTNTYNLTAGGVILSNAFTDKKMNKILFSSGTHTIAGNITTDTSYAGTMSYLNLGTGTIYIGGNVDFAQTTVTCSTSTVIFNKSSSTQTLTSNSNSFYNLTHSGLGTLQLSTNNLTVTGAFLNSSGTFDSNTKNMTFGGNWTNSGSAIFTRSSGTMTFNSTTLLTNSSSNAANLGALTITGTVTLGSSATITSCSGAGTLNLGTGSYTLTISGTGSPLGVTTFNKGTGSTVKYTGTTTATNIATVAYNSLQLSPTAATAYSLTGDLTDTNALSGDLTVNGYTTLSMAGYAISAAGTLTISGGTITGSSSSVIITAKTINMTSGAITTTTSGDIYLYSTSTPGTFTLYTVTTAGALVIGGSSANSPTSITINGTLTSSEYGMGIYSLGDITQNANINASSSGAVYFHPDIDNSGTATFTRTSGTITASSTNFRFLYNSITVFTLAGVNVSGALYVGMDPVPLSFAPYSISITAALTSGSDITIYSWGNITQNADITANSGSSYVYFYPDIDNSGTATFTKTSGTVTAASTYMYFRNTATTAFTLAGISVSSKLYVGSSSTDAPASLTISSAITSGNSMYFCSKGDIAQSADISTNPGPYEVYFYPDIDNSGTATFTRTSGTVITSATYILFCSSSTTAFNLAGINASGLIYVGSSSTDAPASLTISSAVTSGANAYLYSLGYIYQSASITAGSGSYSVDLYPNLSSGSYIAYVVGNSTITCSTYTVNGSLTIIMGTLTANGSNITVTGTFDNQGALQLKGTETLTFTKDTNSGTVEYVGTNSTMNYGYNYYSVTFNNAATTWTLGSAMDVNGTFNLAAGAFAQGANTMNVAGGFTLAASTAFTKATSGEALTFDGTGSVTDNNTVKKDLGAVTSSSGTRTAATNILMSSISVSGGTFIDGGKTITVNGNIYIDSGATLTSTGTWVQGASGNISNPTFANSFYSLTICGSGVTTTLTNDVRVNGGYLTMSGGTLVGGSNDILYTQRVNDGLTVGSLTMGATRLGRFWWYIDAAVTQKAITVPNGFVLSDSDICIHAWGVNLTATGNFNFGNNKIVVNSNALNTTPTSYVDMASYTLTAGTLSMGWLGGYNGYLKLGSSTSHSITGILRGWPDPTLNIIDFESSTIAISGSIDFTCISVVCGTSTINCTGSTTLTSNSQSLYNLNISGASYLYYTTPVTVTGTYTNSGGYIYALGSTTVTGLTTVSGGTYYVYGGPQTFNGGLTISGGAFTGVASAAVDVNGAFTLSSGSFTQGALTLNVSGGFAISSGAAFTKATGVQTVTLDGATQNISDANAVPNDIGAVVTSGTTAVTMTDDLKVTSLSIGDGTTFNLGAGSYTLTITGTGTPLSTNTSGTFNKGTGSTVTYAGTTTATNITTLAYNNLTLTPTAATTYSLTGDLTSANAIAGNLTINQYATLDTGSKNLAVTGTTTINSGGTLSISAASAASTLTITGALTNSGVVKINNAAYAASIVGASGSLRTFSGTDIDYNGKAVILTNLTYSPAVALGASESITLGGECTFASTITLNGSGAALTTGAYYLTAQGTITNTLGTITISSSGRISGSASSITFSNASTVTSSDTLTCGDFTSSGTYTNNSGSYIVASGNVVISGTFANPINNNLYMKGLGTTINASVNIGNLKIYYMASNDPVKITGNDLVVEGSLTIGAPLGGFLDTNGKNLTVMGTTYITSGILTINSSTFNANTISISNILYLSAATAAATISLDNGAELWNSGLVKITDATYTVTLQADAGGTATFGGMDIDYNGKAITLSRLIYDTNATIELGASESITLGGACTLDSPITLNGSGAALNTGAYTMTVTGTITNTLGTIAIASSGMIDGSASSITFSNASVVTSSGTLKCGDFTSTGTYTNSTSSSAIYVSGSWDSSAGTFTASTSTVMFNHASNTQTLNNGSNSFYNLVHSGAGTLQITNNLTLLDGGTLTNSAGTFDTETSSKSVTIGTTGTSSTLTVSGGTWEGDGGTGTSQNITVYGSMNIYNAIFKKSSNTITVQNDLIIGYGSGPGTTTVTSGSGNITVVDDFVIQKGSSETVNFTAPSGTLYVGGDWLHTSGGTFTHNSGTVYLQLLYQGGNKAINIGTTETFYNLTFERQNNASTVFTLSTGSTLLVTKTLTMTFGSYATSAFTINGGTIEAQGDITVASANYNNAGTTAFTLTGSADQAITVTSGATALSTGSALTINKTSGTATLAGHLSAANLAVSGGILAVGTYNLTVSGSSNVTGGTVTIGISSGTGWTTAGMTIGTSGVVTCSGASKINVSGNWNSSSGTFTADSSTVTFNGASAQTITSGTSSFNNVTLSNNSIILLTNALTIGGNLTISEAKTPTITATTNEALTVTGTTDGTADGSAETLTVSTTGAVSFGVVGSGSATKLTTLTITNSAALNFNSTVSITGAFTQTNPATGA